MIQFNWFPLERPELSVRFFYRERGSMDKAHCDYTGFQLYLFRVFLQVSYVYSYTRNF